MRYKNRADLSIAHGALTNSKRPQSFVEGVYPTHLRSGYKCYTFDEFGTMYIDYICSLGANIFGHKNLEINTAVKKQLELGTIFSLGSTLEVEVAERFQSLFPFMERMRFLKTGSEACSASVRIARAYHGVKYNEKEMYDLQRNIRISSFFKGCFSERRICEQMQGVCSELSETTSNNGEKKNSSKKIFTNGERYKNRKETFPKKTKESESFNEGQNLLLSKACLEKETMPNMWEDNSSTSTSRKLYEAIRGNLALSSTSYGKTQRRLILQQGYNGWSDTFVSLTPPHNGVNFDPFILKLEENFDLISEAAAVIIEPVITDASKERFKWLENLRAKCDKYGVLLIFDETITGYRFPGLSVARYTNIIPDLIILGKGIGGGYPLSIIGGRKDVMESDYFVSSTFAGDCVALAAALAGSKLIKTDYDVNNVWEKGGQFIESFNKICSGLIQIEGYNTRGVFVAKPDIKALYFQEFCKAKVLFCNTWFFNKDLISETENVLNIAKIITEKIKSNKVQLEGKPPQTPFAQKQRETKNETKH